MLDCPSVTTGWRVKLAWRWGSAGSGVSEESLSAQQLALPPHGQCSHSAGAIGCGCNTNPRPSCDVSSRQPIRMVNAFFISLDEST